MEDLPVDFEQRVKMSASPSGSGSPVQISAKDLMDNFKHLMDQVPEGETDGDMLVWYGTEWVSLPAPPTDATYVLGSVDGYPTWLATSECA